MIRQTWGNLLTAESSLSDIGKVNPIRYRGYYYDTETGFYYCQSRYYDPSIRRFINADGMASTGQGFLGYNMFAYCLNNPIVYTDCNGFESERNSAVPYDSADMLGGSVGVVSVGLLLFTAVAKLAVQIKSWVASKADKEEYWGHSVYVLRDPENDNLVKYVGRTTDPVRRATEHRNDDSHPERKGYNMKVVATGLNYREARLVEQALISAYSLAYLTNARREIDVRKVDKYKQYLGAVNSIVAGATEDIWLDLLRG